MMYADGACEARSRQEEEDDAWPSSTTTNAEIVHNPHLPSGWRRDGPMALSLLLYDTKHRLVVASRPRRRRARHIHHRIYGREHLGIYMGHDDSRPSRRSVGASRESSIFRVCSAQTLIEDRKGAARASHTPFTPVLVALLGLLLGCGAEPQSKPEPRERALGDLTGSWQLFVDDYLVEEKVQVKRTYHPLQKDPRNPILVSKGPWREQRTIPYGTVLPGADGKGYRMWHDVWDGDCHNFYATSSDGISWTKPSLGLVEHEGSKDNNLLFRRSRLDHMPQVIHTPWEQDPQYHYKLINFDFGRSPPDHAVIGYWGAFSADGIHWKETDRNPVLPDFGDVGHFLWDPYGGRYLGYPKMFAAVRGFSRRSVGVSSSTDFKQWTPAELVLVPDEWDDRWVTEYKQHSDFYGLTVFPYQSMYLGFLWIFRITNGESDGPIFCELVSSRDSINWRRSEGDRVPILPLGEAGSWDDGMVQTLNYPLLEHDTIKVFYGGFDQTHGFRIGRSGVGVATLRKDGFVSLEAGSATGTVTTKPLKNLEGELRLNANAEGGEIRVELLDEDGAIVSGFASTDCEPLEQDGVDQKVSWEPEHDLIPASDKPRRLRFVMRNASLYSFGAGPNVGRASVPIPTEASFTFESDQGRIAGDELIRDGVQRGVSFMTEFPSSRTPRTPSRGALHSPSREQVGPSIPLRLRARLIWEIGLPW